MSLAKFSDFRELCSNQGVDVDPRIEWGYPVDYSRATYGPLDWSIAVCGDLLRADPHITLANRLIDAPPDGDIGLQTLVAIINATRHAHRAQFGPDYSFIIGTKAMDCCSDFEESIITTFENVQSQRPVGGDIIVDSDKNPILFRKAAGQPSALALRPIVIHGIPYPAGSIVRVDTEDAYELDVEGDSKLHSRHPRVNKNGMRVMSSAEVVSADFLRLSPFAYELHDAVRLLPSEEGERLQRLGRLPLAAMSTMIRERAGLLQSAD